MPQFISAFTRRRCCAWSRVRLVLLAGGELLGLERRRVERHVLVCTDCRNRLASANRAVEALHTAAAIDPRALGESPEVMAQPSLWAGVQRQIAESGRTVPHAWRWEVWPTFDGLRAPSRLAWSAFGLAVCLITSVVYVNARVERSNAQMRIAQNERPVATEIFTSPDEPDLVPLIVEEELPVAPEVATPAAALADRAPAPSVKFGYDLERGTPMPIGAHDVKPSY